MLRKVQESQTLLINSQSKRLEKNNIEIIKFGFGQSPFMPPMVVQKALRESVHHKEYSSVQGDTELRELISNFHEEHNGLKVNADNILIAPGSKILIFNINGLFFYYLIIECCPIRAKPSPKRRLG